MREVAAPNPDAAPLTTNVLFFTSMGIPFFLFAAPGFGRAMQRVNDQRTER